VACPPKDRARFLDLDDGVISLRSGLGCRGFVGDLGRGNKLDGWRGERRGDAIVLLRGIVSLVWVGDDDV
jgi:hypothetical protein